MRVNKQSDHYQDRTLVDTGKKPTNANDQASPPGGVAEEPVHFRVVDKRHFVEGDADKSGAVAAEVKPRYPTFVEELMARVAETERRFKEKVAQINQETARTNARLEADYERKLALATQHLLLPFLDVLDNLERALQTAPAGGGNEDLLEGLKMTVGLFLSRLRTQGVEPIEVLNQPFDPNVSQAVGVVPVADQAKDGLVVEEALRGYRMGDALLRAAQVRVGRYEYARNNSTNS
jgi:molecular chaperone GrpE